MKEITLKIPEDKFDFFMEVFNQLGLETSDKDFEIPEWQKEVVLDRIKNAKEEDFFSIDDLDKKINL
ncbi:hypothetical protein [Brumimicrobium oceani]|uniref:Addiction module component n=1 Tax=Brumimicrobium oceani TaxID=2100725 RepID=A0A2U2X0G0_9FLAO|nr:hypothetical protein [Brumimicrobium oceani]PWH81250.1 hypothetical protein DIT68_15765 [Brumimicrobium oceani]